MCYNKVEFINSIVSTAMLYTLGKQEQQKVTHQDTPKKLKRQLGFPEPLK